VARRTAARRIRTTPDAAPDDLPPDDAEDTADADAHDIERGPLRRCIVTRDVLPKEAMIRFVIGPDRTLVPDLGARLPGRGIWLSANRDVIERARATGGLARAFARAARGQVAVPPDLIGILTAGVRRRIIDTLGLARRAGQAVGGFQKAREWVAGGRAVLVLQASDGSAAERDRLLAGAGAELVVETPLDAATLGSVFARDHVMHVAVSRGGLADALKIEAARLRGLVGPADAPMTTDRPADGC
jgi:predicted RNA-binding protein YlxR (DUF448 family)